MVIALSHILADRPGSGNFPVSWTRIVQEEREKDLTRFSPNCACVKRGKGTYSVCHEIAQVVSPDVPGRDAKGQLNFSASVSCLNRGIG